MKQKVLWMVSTLLLALVAGWFPEARGAGMLVADGGLGGRLEIEEHSVDVTINNGIAVTTVDQLFRNLEDRQVEALYTFPIPAGASVANFSMWIDGKEMVGEVVEKERAREIYNSYKRVNRDPGLLEQNDYKSFEMRIFPIMARAEQRVQITYYQELDFDADWATYVYPLATTTTGIVESRTRGRFGLDLEIASEVPIVEIESPSHGDDFAMAKHAETHVRASLETTEGDLNRDVVVAFRTARPVTGLDVIATKTGREDGYFLLTLTPGEELGKASDQAMDFVFVLDVSGSMAEDGKLSLSRSSIEAFVEALGTNDRLELLTFDVDVEALFGELTTADEAARSDAVDFLRRQRAHGGTFLEPALGAAYRFKDPDRPLNVVVLSDGMTEQRERTTLIRMVEQRPSGTRVFCIGVGNDVNRPLLRQIAEEAGGLAAFVSRGDNFERQARAFRRKLLRPVFSNIEMDFGRGDVYDVEPERLPNLYHGAPVRVYGRYRDGGPVTLRLSGTVGGELFEREMELQLPEDERDNTELERMWAWHRVQRLLDDAERAGSRSSVIDEIVELGEGYSIVTEYTSFLVLENDAEYRRWKIDRRNATRIERDRAGQRRVREKLAQLRDENLDIGPATARRPEPTAATPASAPASSRPQPRATRRGFEVPIGDGGGGGGALDPWTALLMTGAGVAGWRAWRKGRARSR